MAETHYTDEELVRGCACNERKYQEALYRKFARTMMYMCMRYTNDPDRVTMIVNDGFLRVFKKIGQYEFKGSLEGWIRKLVFHSISDHFKKESRYLRFLIFEERESDYTQPILSDLYLEDLLEMVNRLPEQTQNVFRLYAIEGYTHVEIGKALGISDGTSKWHLSEARKKLKALIQKHNRIIQRHAT